MGNVTRIFREAFRLALALFAAVAGLVPGLASGQTYPAKPVRIVTSDPGSGNDRSARLLAQYVSAPLGQQVIVDNRPGVSQEVVAKSPPDGYTLLYVGSALWIRHLFEDNAPFDYREFAPITLVTTSPNILVVHPAIPVKTARDLVALAKARPGVLNYGTAGAGTTNHLSAELFKTMARVNMVRIAYKGQGQAVNDLAGGHLDLMFAPAASVSVFLKIGKLRALGVTSEQPSPLLPDLPTLAAAAGLPGYDSVSVTGLMAPLKTPREIIQRLSLEVVRALSMPDVKEKYTNLGFTTVGGTPEHFGTVIKSEVVKWGKVLKSAGVQTN